MLNPYQRLIVNHSLIVFAESLVATFLAIIFLQNGFSLQNILLLLAGISLIHAITLFLGDIFTKYLWLKNMLILGSVFYCMYYYIISFVSTDPSWLFLYLFFGAFNLVFYWFPVHTLFSAQGQESIWKRVSIKRISSIVLTLLAPLVSSYLLVYFGKEYLLYFVMALCILSIFPLIKLQPTLKIKISACKFRFNLENKATVIQILSAIIAASIGVSWPLVIYFSTDGDILKLGYILFLIAILEIAFTFLWGHFFDKKTSVNYLLPAAVMMGIACLAMALLPTFYWIIGITIAWVLYKIANSFFDTLRTLFRYKEANNSQVDEEVYYNQKHSTIGWKLGYTVWILLILVPVYFWINMEYFYSINIIIIAALYLVFFKLSRSYSK